MNATFNVFVFTVNASGTVKSYLGTAGATLGAVVFPTTADGEAVLGFVIVNPTGTGDFVGGTSALDDATVVPNVVYVNSDSPMAALLSTSNPPNSGSPSAIGRTRMRTFPSCQK